MDNKKITMVGKDAGEIIFIQNDEGDTMYKVVSGKVGIYLNYGTHEQIKLAVLGEQSCFGEMSILNDAPRSATAVVLEKAVLLEITKNNFSSFVIENPHNALNIMTNLARMLENNTKKLIEVQQKNPSVKTVKTNINDEILRHYYAYYKEYEEEEEGKAQRASFNIKV